MATKLRFSRLLSYFNSLLDYYYYQYAAPGPVLPLAAYNTSANRSARAPPGNPAIFVCDLQERFRPAIYEFDSIVSTTKKLIAFANTLNIPIHATTQTSAKLGPIIPSLAEMLPAPHDKTKFSMYIPPIASQLGPNSRIAVVGIESHICITQTALDLRDAGHVPYIIADAVSSCNRAEVIVALDRLRAEPGIIVTTSESWMYECVGDASHPAFKGLINVVKNSIPETRRVWDLLLPTAKM